MAKCQICDGTGIAFAVVGKPDIPCECQSTKHAEEVAIDVETDLGLVALIRYPEGTPGLEYAGKPIPKDAPYRHAWYSKKAAESHPYPGTASYEGLDGRTVEVTMVSNECTYKTYGWPDKHYLGVVTDRCIRFASQPHRSIFDG